MKKSKYSAEQVPFAMRQSESGTPVPEVCRKIGISEQTFYRWKRLYGGLGPSEVRRLKQLEEENRRLKQMVADLSLGQAYAAGRALKKALRPAHKRTLVE